MSYLVREVKPDCAVLVVDSELTTHQQLQLLEKFGKRPMWHGISKVS